MASRNADRAVSDEGFPKSFYDAQGREFVAHNAQDAVNARFAWGYSDTKPKPSELEEPPAGPAGDPGPGSGAIGEGGNVL